MADDPDRNGKSDTDDAGHLFLFAGMTPNRLPLSVAVAGSRVRLDRMPVDVAAGQFGMLTRFWGKQGYKKLVGVDELDSPQWRGDLPVTLAKLGINTAVRVGDLVLPFRGVTRSSLSGYMQIDSTRFYENVLGRVAQYFDREVVTSFPDLATFRYHCGRATDLFITAPFGGTPGLDVSIIPVGMMDPTTARFKFQGQIPLGTEIVEIVAERLVKKDL